MLPFRFRDQPSSDPLLQIFYISREFMRLEVISGVLLLIFGSLALILANSPLSDMYFHFWETELALRLGSFEFSYSLHHWINDGLMAIFFFVVGLEIKREVLQGELSTPNQAILPIVAAIGGMLVPALIYEALNYGMEGARGWGIPMATDIAFTLAALAVLGTRVPVTLKVFITALAIVDDIGAVLVIALFYTSDVSLVAVAVALGLMAFSFGINKLGVRFTWPYALIAIGIWFAMLQSGIHATIAGIMAALTVPLSMPPVDQTYVGLLTQRMRNLYIQPESDALQSIEDMIEYVESPLQRFEHTLHPWVTYVILPLFAFANAGVSLSGGGLVSSLASPIGLGIVAGLVVGKTFGISLFTWLAVKLHIADLPQGVSWMQIIGIASLAGIGFTMSMFVSSLAFEAHHLLDTAKLGIIVASLLAACVGWVILYLAPKQQPAR